MAPLLAAAFLLQNGAAAATLASAIGFVIHVARAYTSGEERPPLVNALGPFAPPLDGYSALYNNSLAPHRAVTEWFPEPNATVDFNASSVHRFGGWLANSTSISRDTISSVFFLGAVFHALLRVAHLFVWPLIVYWTLSFIATDIGFAATLKDGDDRAERWQTHTQLYDSAGRHFYLWTLRRWLFMIPTIAIRVLGECAALVYTFFTDRVPTIAASEWDAPPPPAPRTYATTKVKDQTDLDDVAAFIAKEAADYLASTNTTPITPTETSRTQKALERLGETWKLCEQIISHEQPTQEFRRIPLDFSGARMQKLLLAEPRFSNKLSLLIAAKTLANLDAGPLVPCRLVKHEKGAVYQRSKQFDVPRAALGGFLKMSLPAPPAPPPPPPRTTTDDEDDDEDGTGVTTNIVINNTASSNQTQHGAAAAASTAAPPDAVLQFLAANMSVLEQLVKKPGNPSAPPSARSSRTASAASSSASTKERDAAVLEREGVASIARANELRKAAAQKKGKTEDKKQATSRGATPKPTEKAASKSSSSTRSNSTASAAGAAPPPGAAISQPPRQTAAAVSNKTASAAMPAANNKNTARRGNGRGVSEGAAAGDGLVTTYTPSGELLSHTDCCADATYRAIAIEAIAAIRANVDPVSEAAAFLARRRARQSPNFTLELHDRMHRRGKPDSALRLIQKLLIPMRINEQETVGDRVSHGTALPSNVRVIGAACYMEESADAPAHWFHAIPIHAGQFRAGSASLTWMHGDTGAHVRSLDDIASSVYYVWCTPKNELGRAQPRARCVICCKIFKRPAAAPRQLAGLLDGSSSDDGDDDAPPPPPPPASAKDDVCPACAAKELARADDTAAATSYIEDADPNKIAAIKAANKRIATMPTTHRVDATVPVSFVDSNGVTRNILDMPTALVALFTDNNGKTLDQDDSAINLGAPTSAPRLRSAAAPAGAGEPTGATLRSIRIIDDIRFSPKCLIAVQANAPTTRRFHLDGLHRLQRFIVKHPDMDDRPLPQVVLHYLRHSILNARKWWKAQTCHRHLLNICAALRNIEFYADPRNETVPDVSVARDPELNAVIAALGLCSAEAAPTNQLAITMPELVSAFNKEPLEPIKAAIALLASTGCRVGDVLGLQLGNIVLNGNRLDVTFSKGKGVVMRKGMYTIHTLIPTPYLAFFTTYIAGLRGKPLSTLLIPPTASMPENKRSSFINKALKRVNPRLSTRCVRRGVLQAMSMGFEDIPPVPLETLMEYAGHLRPTTTKRYLSWGRLHGDAAFRQQQAARILEVTAAPRPPPTAPPARADNSTTTTTLPPSPHGLPPRKTPPPPPPAAAAAPAPPAPAPAAKGKKTAPPATASAAATAARTPRSPPASPGGGPPGGGPRARSA